MRIFISSVQDEFAEIRRQLKEWLLRDPFVSRFVDEVFLFEDVPSQGRAPTALYLNEVRKSDVLISILGAQYYGKTSVKRGVSATEQEFAAAQEAGVECWAYLAEVPKRDRKEVEFISRVGRSVTWAEFGGFPELRDAVFGSFIDYLDKKKLLATEDFDVMVCSGVSMKDISPDRVKWNIEQLHEHSKKSIPLKASPGKLLTHLGMIKGGRLTNAALLLFGKNPQSVYYQATLKCAWVEGVRYARPFLDSEKYEGDLFALRDHGRNFVLSRIAQSRGIRANRPDAPMAFDIPYEAIDEAILNALMHRNWRSSASIEIRLFADRLEIWSPGHLPSDLTIPDLYQDHDSHPVNKEILKAFDKIGIVESLGTGIERIVSTCRSAGLPQPVFEHRGSAFVVTILKDVWTENALRSLGVSERQMVAVAELKVRGLIKTSEYAALVQVADKTAKRDLIDLEKKGVIVLKGTNKNAIYTLKTVSDIYRTYRTSEGRPQSSDGRTDDEKPLKNKGKKQKRLVSASNGRKGKMSPVVTPVMTPVTPPVVTPVALLNDRLIQVLRLLEKEPQSSSEIAQGIVGLTPNNLRRRYLCQLLESGCIEYTIPDKPGSRLQKYRITAKGRTALRKGGRK